MSNNTDNNTTVDVSKFTTAVLYTSETLTNIFNVTGTIHFAKNVTESTYFTENITETNLFDNVTTSVIPPNDTAHQLEILFDKIQQLENLQQYSQHTLLILTGIAVLFMQIGFPLVQYGSLRNTSTVYVLLVSFFNTLVTCITYWLVGYALAFGGGNKFIGTEFFVGLDVPSSSLPHWFIQFTLSATVVSIVTASMGERASFFAYVFVTVLLSAVIHPVVVHCCWNSNGWLYQNARDSEWKYVDYAGAGVIHLCAGTTSMVSVAMAGTRAMTFDLAPKKSGHVVPLSVAGGFMLLIGLLAIAVGANGGRSVLMFAYASNAITCTLLAAGFGGLVSLGCHEVLSSKGCLRRGIKPSSLSSFSSFLTGSMAGMVAVSAGCDRYHRWEAVVVGIGGSLLSSGVHFLVTFLKGEDPLRTAAVHLSAGMLGLIAAPAFRLRDNITKHEYKIHQKEIAWNAAAGGCIIAWSTILSIIMFGILKLLKQYPIEYDLKGSDILRQGQTTSPIPPGTDPYFPAFLHGNPNIRHSIITRDYDIPTHRKSETGKRYTGHYGHMTNAAYVPEISTQL